MRAGYNLILFVSLSLLLSTSAAYEKCAVWHLFKDECEEGFACVETLQECWPLALEEADYACTYTEQCPKDITTCETEKEAGLGNCKCVDGSKELRDNECVTPEEKFTTALTTTTTNEPTTTTAEKTTTTLLTTITLNKPTTTTTEEPTTTTNVPTTTTAEVSMNVPTTTTTEEPTTTTTNVPTTTTAEVSMNVPTVTTTEVTTTSAPVECLMFNRCPDDGDVCITELEQPICLPRAVSANGYSCNYAEQCPKDSDCELEEGTVNGVCECTDDTQEITDEGCKAKADECSKWKDCPNEEDVCIEDTDPNICLPRGSAANDYACSYTEQCPKSSECQKEGKEDEGTCRCTDEGYIITDEGCVKGIGAECTLLSPCGIENSKCSKFRVGLYDVPRGVCECDKGYEPTVDNTQCQLQGNATDDNAYYCEKDWQCENIHEEDEEGNILEVKCNRWNNVCKCNKDGNYPLNQVCSQGLTSSCVTNDECTERLTNSLCVRGTCTCKDGYLPLSDGFHCEINPSRENNYRCTYDEQCETLQYGFLDSMTCVNEQCSCGEDNVIINNECVHGKIGSGCLLSSACGIKHSVCDGILTRKTCKCEDGLSPSEDDSACGLYCDVSSPCNANSTSCVQGICQCEEGYVAVYETVGENIEMSCVEAASRSNGYACDYQEQCDHIIDSSLLTDKPAQCKKGVCTCEEEHYAIDGNKCLRGLGADCRTFLNKCEMPNTMCNLLVLGKSLLKGTCACKWGFKENDEGYCEPFECRISLRCPKHSDCNEEQNLCVCDEGYVKKDNLLRDECIPLSSPNDEFSCETNLQCTNIMDTSSGMNQTVECNTKVNKCQCIQELWTPAETSDGIYECVPGVGATCDIDEDCQLGNPDSTCSGNKVCTCNEGYIAIDSTKKCAPVSNQAEDYTCSYNEQCSHIPDSSGSFFSDKIATCNSEAGKCTCADGTYFIYAENGKPECVKGLGGSCSMDFSCNSIKNAVCLAEYGAESTCQCKEGYTLPDYEKECIPYATSESDYACDRDEQCSNIIDDFLEPGGSATCIHDKCQCASHDWHKYGPNAAGQVKCGRELGVTCTRNEQCYDFIPYSTCEGKCVCQEGSSEETNSEGLRVCSAGTSTLVSLVTLFTAYIIVKMTS